MTYEEIRKKKDTVKSGDLVIFQMYMQDGEFQGTVRATSKQRIWLDRTNTYTGFETIGWNNVLDIFSPTEHPEMFL